VIITIFFNESLYLLDECKQNPDDDKKPSAEPEDKKPSEEVVDETKQQPSTTVEVEPTSKEVVNESTGPDTVDVEYTDKDVENFNLLDTLYSYSDRGTYGELKIVWYKFDELTNKIMMNEACFPPTKTKQSLMWVFNLRESAQWIEGEELKIKIKYKKRGRMVFRFYKDVVGYMLDNLYYDMIVEKSGHVSTKYDENGETKYKRVNSFYNDVVEIGTRQTPTPDEIDNETTHPEVSDNDNTSDITDINLQTVKESDPNVQIVSTPQTEVC